MYILYMGLLGPSVVTGFFMEPQDLFAEYNKWPEQLQRVSVVQYHHINFRRFGSESQHDKRSQFHDSESDYYINGFHFSRRDSKTRPSYLKALKTITDEEVLDNLRVTQ